MKFRDKHRARLQDWQREIHSDPFFLPKSTVGNTATYERNSNFSLVSSMNQRKYEAWAQFAYHRLPAFEVALRMLETPFMRKDLGRDYHCARDLVRPRLLPSAKIIPFQPSKAIH